MRYQIQGGQNMFANNLKEIRKSKGYTQEELATKIHVVRQTVSKWEKGLSVPDADMLLRIAEVLDVSTAQLLGAEITQDCSKNITAEQLARISEQLAIKNRRSKKIWKAIGIILLVFLLVSIIITVLGVCAYSINPLNTAVAV